MYSVYILASQRNGTLYVGSTSDLIKRIWQHKQGIVEGFTKKYNCKLLVYFETNLTAMEMVSRERQLKTWQRKWKLELIEKSNPNWNDLYESIL